VGWGQGEGWLISAATTSWDL